MNDPELLRVEEMYRADAAAAAAGVPSLALMEAAGTAVVREIRRRWPAPRPAVVLCGPGNNGGDGFVVARLMQEAGWPVRIALLGRRDALKGDAAVNAGRWPGEVSPLSGPAVLDGRELVVDALFGAGLGRPLEGAARAIVEAIDARRLACVAVDVPSGVHGDTGAVLGAAARAALTVTFFRAKPGHFLRPGRDLAGELVVADIGIPADVLADIRPQTALNGPALWGAAFPWPTFDSNKYTRGHAVIVGGDEMTGAARLAARGARRIGAGLVTIACAPEAFAVYAADLPGTLVKPLTQRGVLQDFLGDDRRNAALIGPGAGVDEVTHRRVMSVLEAGKATVLDADALTVFAKRPQALFEAIRSPCVMTPHEGEFKRLFKAEGDKLSRALAAARQSGAIIVLKGSDTVIAAPDGRAAIDASAPPELATGGTGDVLGGFILGLLAQRMEPFAAACAATWIHGQAAIDFGPGLIAEDIAERVPAVLRRLRGLDETPEDGAAE